MVFFNQYSALIYIKKNSLIFYIGDEEKSLELPADTVSDSDIINLEKYEKFIEDFIVAEKITRQKVILVLSGEIVFQKSVPDEDLKIMDERMADFTSMIPLESEKLVKKSIKSEDNMQLFAVNKHLFEKMMEILEKFNFEVLAVVPLPVYSPDNELSRDIIKKIYQDKQLLKNANFLSDGSTRDNSGSSKGIWAVMVFLIMIIFILGFLLISVYLKLPVPFLMKNTKSTQVIPKTSAVVPISTESATPKTSSQSAILDKDQLKVTVLNGTGIAGQAVKVKNLLISLGLAEIEIDNAEGASANDTVVVFSSSVDDKLRGEIIGLLEENFDKIATQEKSGSPSADILITTGKPKPTP